MELGRRVMGRKLVLTLVLAGLARAAELPLMPMPRKVTPAQGELKIDSSFGVFTRGYSDFRLDAAVKRFLTRVERQTGQALVKSDRPTLAIDCRKRSSDHPNLGDNDSYELEVNTTAARLQAHTETGVHRGIENL